MPVTRLPIMTALLLATSAYAQPASTQPTPEDLTTIRTRLLASIVPTAQSDIDALSGSAGKPEPSWP